MRLSRLALSDLTADYFLDFIQDALRFRVDFF